MESLGRDPESWMQGTAATPHHLMRLCSSLSLEPSPGRTGIVPRDGWGTTKGQINCYLHSSHLLRALPWGNRPNCPPWCNFPPWGNNWVPCCATGLSWLPVSLWPDTLSPDLRSHPCLMEHSNSHLLPFSHNTPVCLFLHSPSVAISPHLLHMPLCLAASPLLPQPSQPPHNTPALSSFFSPHSPCITITKRHSSTALHVHSRLLPVGGKVGNCYLHSWAKLSTSDHLGCREQAQRWPHRRSSPCLVQSSDLAARKAVLQPTTGNNNEHLFSALKTGCSPYVWQQVISLRGSFLQGRAVLVVLVQLGSLLGRVILQQHWELCICPNMLGYVYMEGDWK